MITTIYSSSLPQLLPIISSLSTLWLWNNLLTFNSCCFELKYFSLSLHSSYNKKTPFGDDLRSTDGSERHLLKIEQPFLSLPPLLCRLFVCWKHLLNMSIKILFFWFSYNKVHAHTWEHLRDTIYRSKNIIKDIK